MNLLLLMLLFVIALTSAEEAIPVVSNIQSVETIKADKQDPSYELQPGQENRTKADSPVSLAIADPKDTAPAIAISVEETATESKSAAAGEIPKEEAHFSAQAPMNSEAESSVTDAESLILAEETSVEPETYTSVSEDPHASAETAIELMSLKEIDNDEAPSPAAEPIHLHGEEHLEEEIKPSIGEPIHTPEQPTYPIVQPTILDAGTTVSTAHATVTASEKITVASETEKPAMESATSAATVIIAAVETTAEAERTIDPKETTHKVTETAIPIKETTSHQVEVVTSSFIELATLKTERIPAVEVAAIETTNPVIQETKVAEPTALAAEATTTIDVKPIATTIASFTEPITKSSEAIPAVEIIMAAVEHITPTSPDAKLITLATIPADPPTEPEVVAAKPSLGTAAETVTSAVISVVTKEIIPTIEMTLPGAPTTNSVAVETTVVTTEPTRPATSEAEVLRTSEQPAIPSAWPASSYPAETVWGGGSATLSTESATPVKVPSISTPDSATPVVGSAIPAAEPGTVTAGPATTIAETVPTAVEPAIPAETAPPPATGSENPTVLAEESGQSANPAVPASEVATPIAEPVASNSEKTTPIAELATPTVMLAIPAAELATPAAEPPTPTSLSTIPTTEPTTAPTMPALPAAELTTSIADPTTSVTDKPTPAAETANTPSEPTTLPAKPASPVAELPTPVVEPAIPTPLPTIPATETTIPAAESATTSANLATPVAEPAASTAGPATPVSGPATAAAEPTTLALLEAATPKIELPTSITDSATTSAHPATLAVESTVLATEAAAPSVKPALPAEETAAPVVELSIPTTLPTTHAIEPIITVALPGTRVPVSAHPAAELATPAANSTTFSNPATPSAEPIIPGAPTTIAESHISLVPHSLATETARPIAESFSTTVKPISSSKEEPTVPGLDRTLGTTAASQATQAHVHITETTTFKHNVAQSTDGIPVLNITVPVLGETSSAAERGSSSIQPEHLVTERIPRTESKTSLHLTNPTTAMMLLVTDLTTGIQDTPPSVGTTIPVEAKTNPMAETTTPSATESTTVTAKEIMLAAESTTTPTRNLPVASSTMSGERRTTKASRKRPTTVPPLRPGFETAKVFDVVLSKITNSTSNLRTATATQLKKLKEIWLVFKLYLDALKNKTTENSTTNATFSLSTSEEAKIWTDFFENFVNKMRYSSATQVTKIMAAWTTLNKFLLSYKEKQTKKPAVIQMKTTSASKKSTPKASVTVPITNVTVTTLDNDAGIDIIAADSKPMNNVISRTAAVDEHPLKLADQIEKLRNQFKHATKKQLEKYRESWMVFKFYLDSFSPGWKPNEMPVANADFTLSTPEEANRNRQMFLDFVTNWRRTADYRSDTVLEFWQELKDLLDSYQGIDAETTEKSKERNPRSFQARPQSKDPSSAVVAQEEKQIKIAQNSIETKKAMLAEFAKIAYELQRSSSLKLRQFKENWILLKLYLDSLKSKSTDAMTNYHFLFSNAQEQKYIHELFSGFVKNLRRNPGFPLEQLMQAWQVLNEFLNSYEGVDANYVIASADPDRNHKLVPTPANAISPTEELAFRKALIKEIGKLSQLS